jgi:hypothetical protein
MGGHTGSASVMTAVAAKAAVLEDPLSDVSTWLIGPLWGRRNPLKGG